MGMLVASSACTMSKINHLTLWDFHTSYPLVEPSLGAASADSKPFRMPLVHRLKGCDAAAAAGPG